MTAEEVEVKSLSECGSDVDQEMGSDIESEYDIDPMFSSSGESMADIANDVAHKLYLMSGALYTSEGETIVDVLSDIRKALHQLNKILYNKLPNPLNQT